MTTKLELILAAQSAAAASLALTKHHAIEDHKKEAFAKTGVPQTNWQFFSDHFNGARHMYHIHDDTPLEPEAKQA